MMLLAKKSTVDAVVCFVVKVALLNTITEIYCYCKPCLASPCLKFFVSYFWF